MNKKQKQPKKTDSDIVITYYGDFAFFGHGTDGICHGYLCQSGD